MTLVVENEPTKLRHTGAVHVAAQAVVATAMGLPLTEIRIGVDGIHAHHCVVANVDDFQNADEFRKIDAQVMTAQAGGFGERICLGYHRLGDSADLEFIRSVGLTDEAARMLGKVTRQIVKAHRKEIIRVANLLLNAKKCKRDDGKTYRVLSSAAVRAVLDGGKKK